MQTFIRRLAILDYFRRAAQPRSTEDVLGHLQLQDYLAQNGLRSSQLRLVQRDLKFLLGDDPAFNEAPGALPEDEEDEVSNPFGLRSVPLLGKGRGWMLDPLDRQRFDYEKMPGYLAVAFAMTAKHLSHLLPRSTLDEMTTFFGEAERVLQRSERKLAPQHYLRLKDSIEFYQRGQALAAADFDVQWLDAIYQAIVRGREISLDYARGNSSADIEATPSAEHSVTSYRLTPLGVVLMLPKLYLVALNENSQYRHFLLHRISTVTVLETAAATADFSLAAYLADGHMDVFVDADDRSAYELSLEISRFPNDNLLRDLTDYPLNKTQLITVQSPSIAIVTVTVRRTIQLRNWILSLGTRATVVGPEVIRLDIRSLLADCLQNYT